MPIPMLLFCPICGHQHIDNPEPETGWTNPPHKSHSCHQCGTIWRPADVPTVGVQIIETCGRNDNWDPQADAFEYLVNRGIEQIAARILARNLLAKFAKDGEL